MVKDGSGGLNGFGGGECRGGGDGDGGFGGCYGDKEGEEAAETAGKEKGRGSINLKFPSKPK